MLVLFLCFCCMCPRPASLTCTTSLFPYTTLFRSASAFAGPTYVRSPPPGLLDKIVDIVHAATAISEVRQHFGSLKCFFLEVVQKCPDLLLVHLFQRLADLRAVHLDFRRHRLKNAFQPLYLFLRYVLGAEGALAELGEFCCEAILMQCFLLNAPGVYQHLVRAPFMARLDTVV